MGGYNFYVKHQPKKLVQKEYMYMLSNHRSSYTEPCKFFFMALNMGAQERGCLFRQTESHNHLMEHQSRITEATHTPLYRLLSPCNSQHIFAQCINKKV
jgi:hypothetical protein